MSLCLQIYKLWRKLRDLLKEPTHYQVQCQKPKTVLLDTGEMFVPYASAVRQTSLLLIKFFIYLFFLIRVINNFITTLTHSLNNFITIFSKKLSYLKV